jgi:predicted nucleic acid-binding protein
LIVIDASVLANAIGDDGPDGRRARSEVRGASAVAAPDHVVVETVAVLRKWWLTGLISHRRFASAIDELASVSVLRYPTLRLMRRAFELRHNVTPYDAAYVALAEGLECDLLTGDARLGNTPGPRCVIRVLS